MRIIISTTLGALIFLSGCATSKNVKPQKIEHIKTIEKKYIVTVDKATKQAVAILIEKNNMLNQKNKLFQIHLLKQQKELEALKKATLESKQVCKLSKVSHEQQPAIKPSYEQQPAIKPSHEQQPAIKPSHEQQPAIKPLSEYYKVKTFAVNIRRLPTIVHSRVISCLFKGNIVKIIDKQGNWGKLKDGTWISFLALEKIKNKKEG